MPMSTAVPKVSATTVPKPGTKVGLAVTAPIAPACMHLRRIIISANSSAVAAGYFARKAWTRASASFSSALVIDSIVSCMSLVIKLFSGGVGGCLASLISSSGYCQRYTFYIYTQFQTCRCILSLVESLPPYLNINFCFGISIRYIVGYKVPVTVQLGRGQRALGRTVTGTLPIPAAPASPSGYPVCQSHWHRAADRR